MILKSTTIVVLREEKEIIIIEPLVKDLDKNNQKKIIDKINLILSRNK
jgi:hypothetical protein